MTSETTTLAPTLNVIPLGGLHEIGKNITAYEYNGEIIIVDCGVIFPEEEMLGIDLVIPDFTWLVERAAQIKGLFITHGHEDHLGAVPYMFRNFTCPVYGTRLTLALLENKMKEQREGAQIETHTIAPRDRVKVGNYFDIEFIKVSHSIAGSVALGIHTPVGTVVHTGDFKVDYTPVDGEMIDLGRFAQLGEEGVLALVCDSTNVERKGYTMSERVVGRTFNSLFARAEGRRIIIASFASNIHRIQQVVDAARRYGRKITFVGRSMINVMTVAMEIGELQVPPGMLVELDELRRYPQDKMVIITTGSQGETMSGLSRMAQMAHRQVEITKDDLVIISATPIPGNEKYVARVINSLFEHGAEVIYEALADVHVSGHACQEEIKLMYALTKPRYALPVHGEFRHLRQHARLAMSLGLREDHVFIAQNGNVISFDGRLGRITGQVQAGGVMVDGLGIGDVGNIVLRDRRHLSEDGLVVVVMNLDSAMGGLSVPPDIISRGFVYVRESETLMDEARDVVSQAVNNCFAHNNADWGTIKAYVRDELSNFLYERTKRKPMILPIVVET